jgi:hypothetical protein
MRKILLALALLAAALPFGLPEAQACGDKSLRLGRGVRFRRTANPASILIYISPDASPDAVSKAPRLQSFLKKVGHRSRVVQGEGQLGEALGSARYDIVLSSLDEAAGLQSRLESSATRPALVPIVFKGSRAEAARQYRFVVKNASSGEDYLEAIEGAMKTRAHA